MANDITKTNGTVDNTNEGEKIIDVKQEGKLKAGFKKMWNGAKGAVPVLGKVAVMGATAGASVAVVLKAMGEHTAVIVDKIDDLKDVVLEKGGETVESVKDFVEDKLN